MTLVAERNRLAAVAEQKAEAWRDVAFGAGEAELWAEYDICRRESNIAAARADVVYAHYVVAHLGVDESVIFDVTG